MPTGKARPSSPQEASHRATVAAGFVTGLLSGLRSRGLDPSGLLAAAGMDARVLGDRQARVPIASYVALYNTVVRNLGDEGFALFSQPLRVGTFEFLCRAMLGSRDLGEALDRASRFLRLVLPDLRLSVTREGAFARLEIAEFRRLRAAQDDPCRVFAFEWLLRMVHGVACWLVARPLTLAEVRFPFARPDHADDYALIYTELSTFGAKTLSAKLDARALDLAVRRDASDLAAFLEGAPGKITLLYRRDREMARAVRELLTRSLASAPTLAGTARELGVSARTLHRRLEEEGTTFREIKDGVRREAALAALERGDLSVAEVAAALGYSEPSAFFRAFQGWTGEAPSAYRRRHAMRAAIASK
jgi:AraC-like DNA-binding protein